ncbi:hypothetical protein KC345_g240 [Hortaea werneckii]|nr:hypothetical protein KC345_g240 [Hortaea werneckii]
MSSMVSEPYRERITLPTTVQYGPHFPLHLRQQSAALLATRTSIRDLIISFLERYSPRSIRTITGAVEKRLDR